MYKTKITKTFKHFYSIIHLNIYIFLNHFHGTNQEEEMYLKKII